jgi:ribulose-5-phosphate 4-epimerase/fuculose-1-phosphate aldolase
MTPDQSLAQLLCDLAQSIFDRGLTAGSSGNISVRLPGGGYLVTPTNASLGRLTPERLARLDADFLPIGGDPPTKEISLHRAFYETRSDRAQAVVHLHSPYAVALSTLVHDDPDDVLPPYTPYPIMRLGRVPLLPYVHPGDRAMGAAVTALGGRAKAVLLANHGPVVSDTSLQAAVTAAEEFEAAARLVFCLAGHTPRRLSAEEVSSLRARFPTGD